MSSRGSLLLLACRMTCLLPLLMLATGCGGTQKSTFKVTRGGAPVHGALVRAIPLHTSIVPIPLSPANIQSAAAAPGDSGPTNAAGQVTLSLDNPKPHRIEVLAPPLSAHADAGPWLWVLSFIDGGANGGVQLEPQGNPDGRAGPFELLIVP